MRLSTDEHRAEECALETIAAAAAAGITVFDTARAYGRGANELGHNERLLARGLRRADAGTAARIVTKGGMARPGGGWLPDGRAKTIRADCEASLVALDGLPIDLYLIHAPDPRVPWRTSLRALSRLLDEGLVRHVGLSNVNRAQLDEALELVPVAAVQVALGPFDDRAFRGGVVERCEDAGAVVLAHRPFGGPHRAERIVRRPAVTTLASELGATTSEVVLAWLLSLSPAVVALPGAGRPATARSSARAASLTLDAGQRAALAEAFGWLRPERRRRPRRTGDAEVALVMGIPGAGKSRLSADLVARGYLRLNRDERGGTLRALAGVLDEALGGGAERVVLDNTYLTRASRSHALEVAARHDMPVRCFWLDTPLAQAQVNMVERLLDRCGELPSPAELRRLARSEPGVMAPTSQMRAHRELEPPGADEGFASVERIPFARAPGHGRAGVLVAAGALESAGWRSAVESVAPEAPHLLFDWRPHGSADDLVDAARLLSGLVSGPIERAVCPHGGGPPICWCRPPLPGLPLVFARSHGIDVAHSVLVGTSSAHRTLAMTLGARHVALDGS